MPIEEVALTWDPIPGEVNHVWAVDVVHLEELFHPNATELRFAVASSYEGGEHEDPPKRRAWQITFLGAEAYRMRSYGYPGNLPLTRPDNVKACWEIRSSCYLEECSAPNGVTYLSHLSSQRIRLHHYVICTGANVVYEVVAQGWRVTELPERWARPFMTLDPLSE